MDVEGYQKYKIEDGYLKVRLGNSSWVYARCTQCVTMICGLHCLRSRLTMDQDHNAILELQCSRKDDDGNYRTIKLSSLE